MPEQFSFLLYGHKYPLECFPTAGVSPAPERLGTYVVRVKQGKMKEGHEKQGREERGEREREREREMTTKGRWREGLERKAAVGVAGFTLGSLPGVSDTVLIYSGCHNKVPQAQWLKQQGFIFSPF